MLLTNSIYSTLLYLLYLFIVGCFKQSKCSNITRLELIRGVRGYTAEDNVILKAEFKDFKSFMCAKSVLYKYAQFPTSLFFSLGVKDKLKLL
jgi:hypothetical protein